MLRIFKSKKGTSLLEILLAAAIFSIALVPLINVIPSGMKMNVKIDKEINLNQELRSTIIAVNNAIKDPAKELLIAGTHTTKRLIQSDGNLASDFFKVSDTSSYKFRVSGTPTVIEGGSSSGSGSDTSIYGGEIWFWNSQWGAADPTSNTIYLELIFRNTRTTPIDLSKIKIRYYYTNEGLTEVFHKDSTGNFYGATGYAGTVNVTSVQGQFKDVNPPVPGANRYCEISFGSGLPQLGAGNAIELHTRIVSQNWFDFNQGGGSDYSFYGRDVGEHTLWEFENRIPLKDHHELWDKIVVVDDQDKKVWGVVPPGIAGSAGSSISYSYKAVTYNVGVDLYDDNNKKVKTAQIVVSKN